MLTIVMAALGLSLLSWIGWSLQKLVHEVSSASHALADGNRALADVLSELAASARTAEQHLEATGTLVAYAVAEKDSPLSGLYGESDYTFEQDRPTAELFLLYSARRAWKQFAKPV